MLIAKIDFDQKPVVSVKRTPTYSKAVLSWLDREIDAVLMKYCSDLCNLSRKYWPKALRSFLNSLFEKILNEREGEVFAELKVDVAILTVLMDDMKRPTTFYIAVRTKKLIIDILRRIRSRHCKFVFKKASQEIPGCGWPIDIIDNADLNASLSGFDLRRDVSNYIWYQMDSCHPDAKFKISYFASSSPPICIEVEPSLVEFARRSFNELSEVLRTTCELVPADVLQIVVMENLKSIEVHEEALTNGSQ